MMRRVIIQTFTVDGMMTVVAIYRFEGKVVVDLFYLQPAIDMHGEPTLAVMYAGPATIERTFELKTLGWARTIQHGLNWVETHYMVGRKKR